MASRIVTVFGASGFLGRHVVQELAREGWRIRAAVRRPNLAHFLRPLGASGQIHPIQANIRDENSVRRAIASSDAVINLVGILSEKGVQDFEAIHENGAANIARAVREAGVTRLVHVSALGADEKSSSRYALSKARAERIMRQEVPGTVILRPSVVFGAEDRFFNLFASLARLAPVLPLIGGGKTRLQPVYVGDVAKAVARAVADAACSAKTYELGGPQVMTLREVWELVLRVTERRRLLLPIPFMIAQIMGLILGLLPKPLLTRDQVRLLKVDNIVSAQAASEQRTLEGLGITPNAPQAVVPTYLVRFRRTGEFETKPLSVSGADA